MKKIGENVIGKIFKKEIKKPEIKTKVVKVKIPQKILKTKPIEIKKEDERVRVSPKFVTALSVVSILGFAGIVSQTIFNYNIGFYIESLLMLIIGLGLIIEAKIRKLRSLSEGFTSSNITHLITIVVGFIAILAGIFSFPQIRIETPGFLAIKGIIGIIAIIVIIIQTWVLD